MTPREASTRTWGREETRSSRSTSNDATRRMDEKHGSRNKDGRRSDHPTNQETDEERKKDRSSSGKSVEKRRKRMGKRRRNDNLEKPDIRAKRSNPTRKPHPSPPRRKDCRTPWTLQDPGTDHQELRWPYIQANIRRYVEGCQPCQQAKTRKGKIHAPLQPNAIPKQPWEHITIDFITGLLISQGYNAIIVVVD